MNSLTIGQAARLANVGVETVRFYERRGLIEKPPRTGAGYRQYPRETIVRIQAEGDGMSQSRVVGLSQLDRAVDALNIEGLSLETVQF